MNLKILILGSFLLAGCHTVQVRTDLPCPTRPLLQALTVEDLNSMSPDAQIKIAHNQIVLKTYAKKLETRAFCQDDT